MNDHFVFHLLSIIGLIAILLLHAIPLQLATVLFSLSVLLIVILHKYAYMYLYIFVAVFGGIISALLVSFDVIQFTLSSAATLYSWVPLAWGMSSLVIAELYKDILHTVKVK